MVQKIDDNKQAIIDAFEKFIKSDTYSHALTQRKFIQETSKKIRVIQKLTESKLVSLTRPESIGITGIGILILQNLRDYLNETER